MKVHGFSNLDKVGVLTSGFEISTMITGIITITIKTFEKLNFHISKKIFRNQFDFNNIDIVVSNPNCNKVFTQ